MKIMSAGLLGCMILGLLASGDASAKVTDVTKRQKEQAACYDDAMKLCQEFVPDEDKVTTCMVSKKDQLSPRCMEVFNQDYKG
jgi:hypothetical protein